MFKLSFFEYAPTKGAHFYDSETVAAALQDFAGHPCSIYLSERGKPLCDGLYFSISHTDGKAALVISDTPVGIDIERLDRKISIAEITIWDWVDAEATAKLLDRPVREVLKNIPENISLFRMEKDGLAVSMAEYK